MPIDPKKREIAELVCQNFLSRTKTSRQELLLLSRDPDLIDEMSTASLLKALDNDQSFLPLIGTFALLPDDAPAVRIASRSTVKVLKALPELLLDRGPKFQFNREHLETMVKQHVGDISEEELWIGTYLAASPGVSAFTAHSGSADDLEIQTFQVNERILKMPEAEVNWSRLMEVFRNQGSNRTTTQTEQASQSIQNESKKGPAVRNRSRMPSDWVLERALGEGGQGWTYLVHREGQENGRRFVLKRLKNVVRSDRFRAEIEALQNLQHPGILEIVENGEHEGKPYYVSEFCELGDLSRIRPKLTNLMDALNWFIQICSAVSAAHAANIVHRDLKPSNILLRQDLSLAVADFGLCIHLNTPDRFTETGEAVGPRNFIAPELEDGRLETVTSAADVYSLGKLLYFLLTGESFAREKHRHPRYDLTARLGDADSRGVRFVYEVLDQSIVEDPRERVSDASELQKLAAGAQRKLILNAHVLEADQEQLCMFCIDGKYEPLQSPTNWALTLRCRKCGNVQSFNAELNRAKNWWWH